MCNFVQTFINFSGVGADYFIARSRLKSNPNCNASYITKLDQMFKIFNYNKINNILVSTSLQRFLSYDNNSTVTKQWTRLIWKFDKFLTFSELLTIQIWHLIKQIYKLTKPNKSRY